MRTSGRLPNKPTPRAKTKPTPRAKTKPTAKAKSASERKLATEQRDPATAWARDIVAGRIVAGELVIAACERHLRDLKDGKARGLVWRPERAAHALGFPPAMLTITEGAKAGQPFTLLPWHVFVVGSLFGWRTISGRMRFRTAWLETGKGQAKALALDTVIPTPSGWTTMGALRNGDEVFGADGKPCRVIQAHPVVVDQDCYRVTFDDGSEITANAGHLWKTVTTSGGGVKTTEVIAGTLRHFHRIGRLAIVGCERVPSVPVRCITVDSADSMFLCGRAMIPTHNSPLMAAVGIYMMGFYGVPRATVFAIGENRKTANVLFRDAASMCRAQIPGFEAGDSLVARGDVVLRGEYDNAWKIEHPDTGSVFQALANDEAISGPKPSLVAADEIHEFKSAAPLETWARAIAKMSGDALMLLGTNTPATDQVVGTEYSAFYQRVAKGEIVDDEAFAFIARVDKADRDTVFDNEACWQKALPALGITFPLENVRGQVNTARERPSAAASVKRLYFGIPAGVTDFWIDESVWAAVQAPVDPAALKGLKCWLALDLSQKNDLTALSAVWQRRDGHLLAKTFYWTTRDGLAERAKSEAAHYETWGAAGWINILTGSTIDKTFVAAQVARLTADFDVQFLAFDPAGMADFESACAQSGFPVWRFEGADKPKGRGLKLVAHAQGTRVLFEDKQLCMPRSIERLEDRILDRSITIDNSPVTYWCAGNAYIHADGMNNRMFDKKRSRGRIDGLVTLAMATGAAVMTEAQSPMKLTRNSLIIL